ncbi:FAD-dependent oxidoreductase [Amycolatopsis sp. NPDC059021]|uniref:FAD-dependent oxidoreductase n=1 Tax=Amycolatopsis sp. NPDC059021 TaxID=3346704 RepID=UPI003672C462
MTSHALVAGGGIAGCASAIALRKAGIEVTVIDERPADNGGAGAFLRLNPNGLDALQAIDALQSVLDVSMPLRRRERWSTDGRLQNELTFEDPDTDRGLEPRFVTWARLQGALHDHARRLGTTFQHGARVTSAVETGNRVSVTLANGRQLDGDILIGADGTRSTIRTLIDPDAPQPEYRGSRTVYGYTPQPPADTPPANEMLRTYLGPSLFLAYITDPVDGCYWFTNVKTPDPPTTPAPDTEIWRRHLLQLLRADNSPAEPIVRAATQILASDDRALPHLPHWHSDRAVVIGDAAHVAPPGSEQGASMALEDAVVLGQCLRDLELATALSTFVNERRERAETVVALSTGRRSNSIGPEWAYLHHLDWQKPAGEDVRG